jgi:hypothetical protein
MSSERQPKDIRLTGIHIDLIDQVVTLEAQDGRKARLSFGQPTTLFETHPRPPTEADTPDELVSDDESGWSEPDSVRQRSPEQQQTVVLNGQLRTQPKAGRPDRQGRPTAWARLAVSEEGAELAHLYTATFYRATTAIALRLSKGSQLTVEGYPHAGDATKKRLDTLSVIALHEYPGRPNKQGGEGVT